MGGQTAIGFETSNGQVYYCLVGDYVGIMEAIEMFKTLDEDECDKTADSVHDFFYDANMYEEEDTVWRIVKMLDGNIHAKCWGVKGVFSHSEIPGPL